MNNLRIVSMLSDIETYNVLYFSIVYLCYHLARNTIFDVHACCFRESNLLLFFNCMQAAFVAITSQFVVKPSKFVDKGKEW